MHDPDRQMKILLRKREICWDGYFRREGRIRLEDRPPFMESRPSFRERLAERRRKSRMARRKSRMTFILQWTFFLLIALTLFTFVLMVT
jgi:hypothetical protein